MLFTPDQLSAIYSCINGVPEVKNKNHIVDEEEELQAIRDRIANIVPDLDERIANMEQKNVPIYV